MKSLKTAMFFLLVIFSSCQDKNQVESDVYQKINFLFKNMGRLDRTEYDSIFTFKGCEKDTMQIKNSLSEYLKIFDSLYQKLDKENLVIEYYNAATKSKLELVGITNKDTVVSVTDKHQFGTAEGDIPFLLKIENGKIASFGMMQKSNQIYLLKFCN